MTFDFYIGTIEEVLAVDYEIPEFGSKMTKEKLANRLEKKANLILIASHNGIPIAYKVGYEKAPHEFYSWLGGVVPAFRKLGVATVLREQQETWVLENGYRTISVKSMNKYPAMLQLLISSGYQIFGYEDNGSSENSKIQFIKQLNR